MLHNNKSPRVSLQPSSRKTPPPGANGRASAAGSNFTLNSSTLMTPFPSSIFSPSASVPSFCPCRVNLSRRDRLRNTSAQLVKSLHPWGPTTPATTAWGSSTFCLDTSWHTIRGRIILQQECGPSLSEYYKPWTPPPREPPQEISQSATSPGLPYPYSFVQANTARAVPTPTSTPSVSRTSNYSLYIIPTTPQRCPTPCLLRPTLSASCSQPIITASGGN